MKLPIPFLGGDKNKQEYYLALLLTDEKVGAVILEEVSGKIKILSTREELFSESLETIPLDNLAQVIDKAITRAEEVLPPDIETHKTVFGLKTNWVEDETKKIKRDYLGKLKKICDALDLTPIGFMVLTEAVSYLMQQEEGAPLSAVLAELEKGRITVTLLRGGKVVETKDGPLTGSASEMLDQLLRHFTVPVLPARIIIISSKGDEKLSQEFISHQWSKGLPFLHVPQVSVLPSGVDAKAVAFGAATQMGFELVGLSQHMPLHDITLPEQLQEDQDQPESEEEESTKEKEDKEEEPPEETPPPSAPLGASAFGFVMDADITKVHPPVAESEEKETEEEKPEHAMHQDNYWGEQGEKRTGDNFEEVSTSQEENYDEDEASDEEKPSLAARLSGLTAGLRRIKLPKIAIPGLAGGNKTVPIFIGLVVLVVLFIGLTIFYLYKVQATVVLSVTPKQIEQSQGVTFSTDSSSDFAGNVIAAKPVSVTIDGTKTGNATGKKQTGDKAQGTVTLYNSSNNSQSLDSGTTITSSNNLVFTLDKDVTVASASGDIFSGTKPGTADVTVTAKDIGTDYNLPSGTTFTVGSGLAAKNSSAFSGGSKKDIIVVSKDDQTKLKADLANDVTDNAKEQLVQKSSGNTSVLPVMLSSTFENAKFDKQVGDEAKTEKLTASVTFTGASYSTDDINNFGKALIQNHYSQDVSIASNTLKTNITDVKQKDNKTIQATVKVQAGLLPKIDTDSVVQQLQNKSVKQAKDTLSSLPQVASSDIKFSPNIPLLPLLFPQMPKHITVVMKAAE